MSNNRFNEPLDYCHRFNLLSSEQEFNRLEFLNGLYSEFLEYYLNDQIELDKNGIPTYRRWTQIVNNYYQKFWSISKAMASSRADHKGLTKKLWGFFYARYLIPFRDSKYPEMATIIYSRKRNRLLREQDKINKYDNRQVYP